MGIEMINVDSIRPNPNNPRKNFDEAALEELAASIREVGILQPLVVVTEVGEGKSLLDVFAGEGAQYRLVCGERRYYAAMRAGLAEVPAVVRTDLTPAQEAEIMLIENLQRKDLDPIEEAQAYRALLDGHGYTQEALGEKLGVSQGHIANRLRLLELPDSVQENISRGIISASHGKVLAGHKNLPEVVLKKAAKAIADENIPVSRAVNEVYKAVAEHGRPLESYEVKFDKAECKECQHKAKGSRWGGNPDSEYCLKHQCYDKKQAEAVKAREDTLAKKLEKVLKEGQKIVDLDELGYGNYEDLNPSYGTKIDKVECKECEHRGFGTTRYDSKPKEVCLKPSCYRKKKSVIEREKNKELRDAFQVELEEISKLAAQNARSFAGFDDDSIFYLEKHVMVYIVGRILADVEPSYDRKITRQKYLKDKFDWQEDWLKNAYQLTREYWGKLSGMLSELTEKQLLEVLFEWPAFARGLNDAEGWLLRQAPQSAPEPEPQTSPEPKEEPEEKLPPGISSRVGWILRNSAGDINYITNIPNLTDAELLYCILNENRQSGLQKLKAEARKRGLQVTEEQRSTEIPARRYLDKNGRIIFVDHGLWSKSGETEYGTFWQSASGGHHRVKTQAMPMVTSREEAQRNLDAWAEKNGLQPVEGDGKCDGQSRSA